jgi:CBS domain-containing protein
MKDVFVGRVMSSPVETIHQEASVRDAADLMLSEGISSVVVVDEANALEGIITTTDFVRMVSEGAIDGDVRVAAFMTDVVETTTANAPVEEIAHRMVRRNIHHVPVVDEAEGVVGIVSTTDLTAYLSSLEA